MPKYIDANLMTADIHKYLCASCSICCTPTETKNSACDIAECLRMIDNAPTADVQEIKHGRWIGGYCSRCSKHAPYWSMASTYYESMYCPNCGAKMDGDNNGQK